MKPAPHLVIVIPATAGREENLKCVLAAIGAGAASACPVVVVDDGGQLAFEPQGVDLVRLPKHRPGLEQPRNAGVRIAQQRHDATHVWFVDSDVVLEWDAYEWVWPRLGERVLACPYDWLGSGERPSASGFWATAKATRNDPRWPMFEASGDREYRDDLSAGLACFSGNLVWPVEEFARVGGFWSELHHGRCEDGELGLRAVAMQVPISMVAGARGFHLRHDVNTGLALQRNARDVPMLNLRHPWVQGANVFLSDRDGAAFDVRCACGEVVPTIGWWAHADACEATGMELTA